MMCGGNCRSDGGDARRIGSSTSARLHVREVIAERGNTGFRHLFGDGGQRRMPHVGAGTVRQDKQERCFFRPYENRGDVALFRRRIEFHFQSLAIHDDFTGKIIYVLRTEHASRHVLRMSFALTARNEGAYKWSCG